MKLLKILLAGIIFFNLACEAFSQANKDKTEGENKTKTNKIDEPLPPIPADDDLSVIAEGSYSSVEKPFVFVARSSETYARLQKLVENLTVANIDFTKTAVVAAFAGTKPTGGFSVSILKTTDKLKIDVSAPPRDAMVTQALTSPFKVVLASIESAENLRLDVSSNWKNSFQTYKVSKGEFEFSDGITGRGTKFNASGTINVISFENLATLSFNLSGKGTEKSRILSDSASGSLSTGKLNLARLSAGSFAQNPKPPVKVFGTVSKNKLSLTFEPLSTNVADGFQVSGKIDAVRIK